MKIMGTARSVLSLGIMALVAYGMWQFIEPERLIVAAHWQSGDPCLRLILIPMGAVVLVALGYATTERRGTSR